MTSSASEIVRSRLAPRWIALHISVVAVVVLMVNLGFWQLRRLDERRADNASIVAASRQDPVDIEALLVGPELPLDHTPAVAVGRYLVDGEFLVANRSYEGQAGYWMVTPLQLTDGRVVAVVRGFVPRLVVAGVDDFSTEAPTGTVTVEGSVFASVGGGRIAVTGEGDPAQLSRLDLDLVPDVAGMRVEPLWLRLDTQQPVQTDLPVPIPPPDLSDGPHLSYAVQWFLFSVSTIVFYVLLLRRGLGVSIGRGRHQRASRSVPQVVRHDPVQLLVDAIGHLLAQAPGPPGLQQVVSGQMAQMGADLGGQLVDAQPGRGRGHHDRCAAAGGGLVPGLVPQI
ncbi:MAG: SURF1 family protein, partial [Acidimicrobiales bacterium]